MATASLKDTLKAAAKGGVKVTFTALPAIRRTLPKTRMGALVDEYHDIREVRLLMGKLVDALKAEEQRILDHVIETVDADSAGESGCVGARYKGIIVREDKPIVEDWDKFYAHISKTKSFDLLNKAVNAGAVKERWENKKKIPGVGKFQAKKLSVTKVK